MCVCLLLVWIRCKRCIFAASSGSFLYTLQFVCALFSFFLSIVSSSSYRSISFAQYSGTELDCILSLPVSYKSFKLNDDNVTEKEEQKTVAILSSHSTLCILSAMTLQVTFGVFSYISRPFLGEIWSTCTNEFARGMLNFHCTFHEQFHAPSLLSHPLLSPLPSSSLFLWWGGESMREREREHERTQEKKGR